MDSSVGRLGRVSASDAARASDFSFSDREFQLISDRIKKLCGIHLPESKRMLVYSRLSRRLRALGLSTFGDYVALLDGQEADKELPFAINALTTNLTRFYREPHHFDHLRSMVIPNLFTSANRTKRIRFWSAGCSSGEEPYSIAMTVLDAVPSLSSFDFRVLATDIDTDMITRSQKAVYDARELDSIPEPMRSRDTITMPDDRNRFSLSPEVKELVSFKQLNLIEGWPMAGPFDVIFCRNVMIYFEPDVQKMIVDRMANLLAPGGFLYIGHSENMTRITDSVELVGATVYARSNGGTRNVGGRS